MPRNDTLTTPAGVWTQITAGDVTALRAQNQGSAPMHLKATVGAVAPTSLAGSLALLPFDLLTDDRTLASLWPGVAGVNRVYAYTEVDGEVSVSHA